MLSLVNVVTSAPSNCSIYNNSPLLGVKMDPEPMAAYDQYLTFTTFHKMEFKVSLQHSLLYTVIVRNDSNLDNPYLTYNEVEFPVLNLGDDFVDQRDFVGITLGYLASVNIRILVHLYDWYNFTAPLQACALFEQSIIVE
ncbi:19142_t:CDS:1 [Gigaspora rosea]|nr:19142_t:CDS:1 [Gigaspora rosea]